MITTYSEFKNKKDIFGDWLKEKMKLSKIEYLASGFYGFVFDIGDDKVLKITRLPTHLYKKTLIDSNKSKYIAKPFQIGTIKVPEHFIYQGSVYLPGSNICELNNNMLSYIILEKLDTSNISHDFDRLLFAIKDYTDSIGVAKHSSFSVIINNIRSIRNKNPESVDNDIVISIEENNSINEAEKIRYKRLYKMIMTAIDDVIRIFPKYDDYHDGQFGYDKNGVLKIFDILPNGHNKIKVFKKTHIE